MMSGRPPFQQRGLAELLAAHASDSPPPPESLGMALPEGLEELILHMLLKVPAQRPNSMGEVAATLRRIASSLPPANRPFHATPPPVR
jgi:hypothetical protein